jgi:hypothetical protein
MTYIVIMKKVWNIARIAKIWKRDTKCAHAVGKLALARRTVATNLQFLKIAISSDHTKPRYACI